MLIRCIRILNNTNNSIMDSPITVIEKGEETLTGPKYSLHLLEVMDKTKKQSYGLHECYIHTQQSHVCLQNLIRQQNNTEKNQEKSSRSHKNKIM
uniref:Uncharacterized protein n=1 Tax=Arion vulgaris TaxID=1028688 RepID=A0A0B6YAP1_9EUPU